VNAKTVNLFIWSPGHLVISQLVISQLLISHLVIFNLVISIQ